MQNENGGVEEGFICCGGVVGGRADPAQGPSLVHYDSLPTFPTGKPLLSVKV